MEPIVNPLWFYFISLCGKIESASLALAWICGVVAIIYGVLFAWECDFDTFNKEQKKKHMSNIKKFIFATVALAIVNSITPSEDTCYKMAAATYVTSDNLTKVGETAENVVDYIVDKVDQLVHGGNNESDN